MNRFRLAALSRVLCNSLSILGFFLLISASPAHAQAGSENVFRVLPAEIAGVDNKAGGKVKATSRVTIAVYIDNDMHSEVRCIGYITILGPDEKPVVDPIKARLKIQPKAKSNERKQVQRAIVMPSSLPNGSYRIQVALLSPDEKRVFTEATTLSSFTIGDSTIVDLPTEPEITVEGISLNPDKPAFLPGDEFGVIVSVKNSGADAGALSSRIRITGPTGSELSDLADATRKISLGTLQTVSQDFAVSIPTEIEPGAYTGIFEIVSGDIVVASSNFGYSILSPDAGVPYLSVDPVEVLVSTENTLSGSADGAAFELRSNLIKDAKPAVAGQDALAATVTLRLGAGRSDEVKIASDAAGGLSATGTFSDLPVSYDISGSYKTTVDAAGMVKFSKFSFSYLDPAYAGWIEIPCALEISSGGERATAEFKVVIFLGEGIE